MLVTNGNWTFFENYEWLVILSDKDMKKATILTNNFILQVKAIVVSLQADGEQSRT